MGLVSRITFVGGMSPIKDLSLTYEALNEEITFSAGDTIVGTVTFNLTKDTKVKRCRIKAKGDANVHWTEGSGDDESYSDHRRYFEVKENFGAKGIVLPKGFHHFKFRIQIPQGDFPSSFKGCHGSITYMLEARISRSWRFDSTTQKEISFVSKTFPHMDQVMCTQSGSVTKEMGVFSKTQVQLSATASKKVCSPGDTLSFVAKIGNSSSKNMKSKFKLVQKIEYCASCSTNSSEKILAKVVGDTIKPRSEETVSCQLTVPADAIYTIHNCEILTVEYYVKKHTLINIIIITGQGEGADYVILIAPVSGQDILGSYTVYVDISFAFDPEVVFPLVVVSSALVAMHLGEAAGPYPPGAVGAQSYSDFPPPSFSAGLHPLPAGPSANAEAPMPSLVQPPAITVPPQFQQGEDPPSYTTLYPPSYDTLGSGSDHKS